MEDITKEERQKRQADLAEKLQDKWLQNMLDRLEAGTLSDTGMATLERFFARNGWVVDPSRFQKSAKDLLKSGVDPTKLSDDDPDVVGKIA